MSTCGLLEFKDSSKCSLERSRATSIEKKVIQMNNIFIQTGQLPIRDSELVYILNEQGIEVGASGNVIIPK